MPSLLRQWTGVLQLLLLLQLQTSSVRGSSSLIAYDSVTWAAKGHDASLSCNVTEVSYRGPIHIILLYHNDSQKPIFYLDNRQGSLQSALEAARGRHPRVRVQLPAFLRMGPDDGDEARSIGEQTLPVLRPRPRRSVSSSRAHPDGESMQLVLTGVAVPDTGLYRCRVDYKKHQTVNFGTYLNVVEGPWHLDILSNLEYYRPITNVTSLYPEGSNLTLICRVTGGVPRPSVSWFDSEKRIILSQSHNDTGTSDVTTAQITIVNLNRSDDGRRLRCSASNTAVLTGLSGPLAATITIRVASPPLYIGMSRQGSQLPAAVTGWLEPGSVVAVAVGSRLSLLCESGGALGSPGLTWRLGNQTLGSQAGSDSRVIISESVSSSGALLSHLSLVASWGDHNTIVECRIRPPALLKGYGEGGVLSEMEVEKWTLGTTLSMYVHGPPNVTISMAAIPPPATPGSGRVLAGTRVVLLCAVTSLPAMHAQRWYHNGGLILLGENGEDDTGISTDSPSTKHIESGNTNQNNTPNDTYSQWADWDDVTDSERFEIFQDQYSGDGLDDSPSADEVLEADDDKQSFRANISFESFNNPLDDIVTANKNLSFYVTTLQDTNQTNSFPHPSRSRSGAGAFAERESRTQISSSGSEVSIVTSMSLSASDPLSLTLPYDAKTRLVSDDGERTAWELELSNVRLEHAGKYECQADNSEGSGSSGTVDVIVLSAPRCRHPGGSNVTVRRLGQQLALTCDVVAEPPPHAYRWDVPESHPYISKGGTLYLVATESMPAQVACQAENIVGANALPCFINFAQCGLPGGVSQCSIVPTRGHDAYTADVTVTCMPGWDGGLLTNYTLQIDHQTNSNKVQTKVERLSEVTGRTEEDFDRVEFDVWRLQTHMSYIFTIFAENTAGRGNSVTYHYELDMDNLVVPPVKSLAIEEEEDSELFELLIIVKVVGYAMGFIAVVAVMYFVFTLTKKKVYDAMPVLRDHRDSLRRELSQDFPDPNQSYIHFRNDIDKEALLGSKRRSHGLLEIEGGLASLLLHDVDSFETASPYPPAVLEPSLEICRIISKKTETLLNSESQFDASGKDGTGDECLVSSDSASDEGSRNSASSAFSSSTSSTVVVNPNYFLTPDKKTIVANIDVDETNENNENACRPSERVEQKYDGDYSQTLEKSRQPVLQPVVTTELQVIDFGVKRSKTKSPMLGSVGRYSLKRFRKIQRSDPHVIGCSPDCGRLHKCEGSLVRSVHGDYEERIEYAVPYELKDNLPLDVNFEIVETVRKDENDYSSELRVNGSLSGAESDTNNNKEPNYDVPYNNDSPDESSSSTTKRNPSRHHFDSKSILSIGEEGVHEANVDTDNATKQNVAAKKRCSLTPKLKCGPPVYVNIDDCSLNAPLEVKHDPSTEEENGLSYTKNTISNGVSVIHNMVKNDVFNESDISSIEVNDISMGTNV